MRNGCLLGAGVALAVAFGCAQANAQVMGQSFFGPYPPGAFYLGPEGGWTQLTSQNPTLVVVDPQGNVAGRSVHISYDGGFNAGVRAGYMWGPWRFEGEYSYRENGVDKIGALQNSSGNSHSNAIMANAIYDFTFGWPITPHVGAGVGGVNLDRGFSGTGDLNIPRLNNELAVNPDFNGNQWVFGYQAIAGIRYFINPAIALDVDYRYFSTPSRTIDAANLAPVSKVCCVFSSFKSGYNTQNIVASLTMMFGAPPPAAPPPAPPAPPPPPPHQVYLVFFDWDKYNITPEGTQILEAAAAHFKAGGAVQIQVTGYTDLTGSAGYNQRLSERRANAVAVALGGMGVPRNEMVVAGRGMNDPRVPTPLGVREPQNRRVEIVFP
jgi:OmpA-OmpF porin, OOP family